MSFLGERLNIQGVVKELSLVEVSKVGLWWFENVDLGDKEAIILLDAFPCFSVRG